jgi:hypothetical protein
LERLGDLLVMRDLEDVKQIEELEIACPEV